jgi:PAS domain S-box-containing protein
MTRVLHLEDNPHDAELIQHALKAACPEAEIVWARNGVEYRAAIERESFDLIVCDYNLPDYDGLAALEAARRHQPQVPVIMVTGTLSEDEAVDCIRAGAVDYMLKGRLQRLPPAIVRALREARESRERARAEAALRISEARLGLALEAAEVSVWEYDLQTGNVVFSRQLGPMLGYRPDEVPGRIDTWEALTHPADVEKLRAALARHYAGETAAIEVEYRVRARGGEWRWLRTVGRTVERGAEDRPLRLAGTHMDITERRRFDEMLRLQERAIDAASSAIVIVDARASDYPIVHVNRTFERITGYAPEEVLGRNCRFLQGADRDQAGLERLREAIPVGGEACALLRNYRKDGSLFWMSVRISPVRDASGALTHFVGVQTGITDLQQYLDEVENQLRLYETHTST